jgi:hypothetical protein
MIKDYLEDSARAKLDAQQNEQNCQRITQK